MYTLINDLWKSQQFKEFKNLFLIPQTIIINQGFRLNWYFTKDNKIYKRTDQKTTIDNIVNYFATTKAKINLITIQQQYSIVQSAEATICQEIVSAEQLRSTLEHYKKYPYLIENPIIIQEALQGQCVSLTWNKYYTFVQDCDQVTFNQLQEIKISPHFRQLLDNVNQQLVERIQLLNSKRGNLQSLRVIYILKDKPYFLWCVMMSYDKETLVSNLEMEGQLWVKNKNFKLTFQNKKEEIIRKPFKLKLRSKGNSNICNQENHQDSVNRSIQDKSIERSRKSIPLTNRSLTNRSVSIIKQPQGSITQRGEENSNIINSIKINQNSYSNHQKSRTVVNLKRRIQEIKLKGLF